MVMTDKTRELLSEALRLSRRERAEMASELLASIDEENPDPGAEEAWDAEIERRANRVVSGQSNSRDLNEVKREIERDILGR
jgi:putative addiction module component (TIGR02574 family)